MANRLIATCVCAMMALLGACGGGSGGTIASAPLPIPTPAPTPTSTYHRTSHASMSVDARLERLPDGSTRVAGIDSVQFVGVPTIGNLEILGPNSYAVEFGGMGGPAFPAASYIGSDGTFDRYRSTDQAGNIANLDIASSGPGFALTYTGFGNVVYSWGLADNVEINFFSAGRTTPSGQMPRTGTANYSGIADGLWIDGPFGNFLATGTTALGTFTGVGSISNAYFDGTFARNQG